MSEPSAVDSVVFDLGGVVLDWDPLHLYAKLFADRAEAQAFLREVCTFEWHAQHDLGRPMSETVPQLCAEHPHRALEITAWQERYLEMVAGYVEGTVELIESLTRLDVPIYALTNMPADVWPQILREFPALEQFDGFIVSGVETIAKPDPRIFALLETRFGLTPNRTVFVDDSAVNVDAAWTLGFRAIRFESAQQLREVLARWGLPLADG
jgi:2-haloacid dehalogenase